MKKYLLFSCILLIALTLLAAFPSAAAASELALEAESEPRELLQLGASARPITVQADTANSRLERAQRPVLGLMNRLLSYAYLLLAFSACFSLFCLINKARRLNSTAIRQQLYFDKLKQAEALGFRLGWYKFLLYFVLTYCLLAYPWLALSRLLPLASSFSAFWGELRLALLLFSALLFWSLLYATRHALQKFSRLSLPLLMLIATYYVAERLFLHEQSLNTALLSIYSLVFLGTFIYFIRRKKLFGPLPSSPAQAANNAANQSVKEAEASAVN